MKDRIEILISQLNAEIAKEGDSGLCFVAPDFLGEIVNTLEQVKNPLNKLSLRNRELSPYHNR